MIWPAAYVRSCATAAIAAISVGEQFEKSGTFDRNASCDIGTPSAILDIIAWPTRRSIAGTCPSEACGRRSHTGRSRREGRSPSFGAVSHGTFRLKNIAEPIGVVEILWSADQTARAPHPESDD